MELTVNKFGKFRNISPWIMFHEYTYLVLDVEQFKTKLGKCPSNIDAPEPG